jgi:hypothetical protein
LDAPIVGSSSTPVAVATPGKDATLVVDALGPLGHEKSDDKFTLPASELAQSSPQRLTTVEPASRNKPKPTLANQNKSFAQLSQNAGKGSEPKPARALTGFVEMQGNNLLTNASPEERREPQGYITVESKPEPLRSGVGRNRSPKPSEPRPKIQEASTEPADDPPKSQDDSSKHRDSSAPAKTVGESADLQRFASDFVRTNRSGSITDQHRFYADSVHFYGEGDLSWAGVAAATRRYHQERQNRRYAAAAAAVVKGPVDGGFYVLDQPVSWVQMNGSRGRCVLRLRVIPTVRSGWKITSIEEL